MSVRDPGSLSRANGAYLVVDHFLRGWRLMMKKKKKKKDDDPQELTVRRKLWGTGVPRSKETAPP